MVALVTHNPISDENTTLCSRWTHFQFLGAQLEKTKLPRVYKIKVTYHCTVLQSNTNYIQPTAQVSNKVHFLSI